MFNEILEGVLGGISLALMIVLVIESSRAISERKRRHKMGLTDYYDQPIRGNKEDTH